LKDPIALYSLATVISGAAIVFLFYIPGLALYYFSNIAFFVALPTIVTLATRGISHRRITDTAVLFCGIAIIVGLSLKSYYRASALSSMQTPRQQSSFIRCPPGKREARGG